MTKELKKFSYSNTKTISNTELKLAMGASALLVLFYGGLIDLGSGVENILIQTGLTVFVWWAFHRYFVNVGDKNTARWLIPVVVLLLVAGLIRIPFQTNLDLGFIFSHDARGYALNLLMALFYLVLGGSVLLLMACFRILWINKQHSFPLKRIALSAAIAIPLFVALNSLSSIKAIQQAKLIPAFVVRAAAPTAPTLYEDAHGEQYITYADKSTFFNQLTTQEMVAGLFNVGSSIANTILSPFVFMYYLLIAIPYVFLFFHFYKTYRANLRKKVIVEDLNQHLVN